MDTSPKAERKRGGPRRLDRIAAQRGYVATDDRSAARVMIADMMAKHGHNPYAVAEALSVAPGTITYHLRAMQYTKRRGTTWVSVSK